MAVMDMDNESEHKMVELKERETTAPPSCNRITPAAAGCFGYTQPRRKPAPCETGDLSVFAALFTKSI